MSKNKVQLIGSVNSNLLIGQGETLPNITGFIDTLGWAARGYFARSGAIKVQPSTAMFNPATVASSEPGYAGWMFDASQTEGTGKNIYKEGAHVQPNTITCRYWLRQA